MDRKLTAIIEREGSGYVALCPELDIASQGDNIEQARENIMALSAVSRQSETLHLPIFKIKVTHQDERGV